MSTRDSLLMPATSRLEKTPRFRIRITDSYTVNGVCLERVEAIGRKAFVYRRSTNILLRSYTTDFDILNAVYVTFASEKRPEVYLCLVGYQKMHFYELLRYENTIVLSLPFKICMAHRCSFGLLLERDFDSHEAESAQLFSLTHPYNEFFPVLYKLKDANCYYALRNRRMCVVPDSCNVSNGNKKERIHCYNLDNGVTSVFVIRRCTQEEKTNAKEEMWLDARGFFNLSIDSTVRTISAANNIASATNQSFFSPNVFTARTADGRPSSPIVNDDLQANAMNCSEVFASPQLRITPVRQHSMKTRSMVMLASRKPTAAAEAEFNNADASVSGLPAINNSLTTLASSTDLNSGYRRRSTASQNLLQYVLSNQHRRLRLTSTPITATGGSNRNCSGNMFSNSTSIMMMTATATDKLLTLGEERGSLECAVEYCLDWVEDLELKTPELTTNDPRRQWARNYSASLAANRFITPPVIQSDQRRKAVIQETATDSSGISFHPVTPLANAKLAPDINAAPQISNSQTTVLEHYETPQQKYLSGQGLSLIAIRTNCLKMAKKLECSRQRLALLDATILNKLSSKNNSVCASKLRETSDELLAIERTKYCRQRWGDNRLNNVTDMLDSAKPILIPSKYESCSQEMRDQQLQFLGNVFLKTITRSFGQALLTFSTVRPIPNKPFEVNPICFKGKIGRSGVQVEYPPPDSIAVMKPAIEWASFYNGVAHGLAVLGFGTFIRHNVKRKPKKSSKTKAKTSDGVNVMDQTYKSSVKTSKGRKLLRERQRSRSKHRRNGSSTFSCGGVSEFYTCNSDQATTIDSERTCKRTVNDVEIDLTEAEDSSADVVDSEREENDAVSDLMAAADWRGSSTSLFRHRHQRTSRLHSVMSSGGISANNPTTSWLNSTINATASATTIGGFWRKNSLTMSVGADSTMLTDYDVAFGEEITRNRLESSNPNSTTVVFDWEFLCMNLRAHQELPPVQAGFLLASGLTGHIRSINLYDIHSFLTKNNKFFAIAILLGCAIAHRGTSDIYVNKMLTTHLPFLMAPTLCEFKIEASIQTSAVVALGYLHAETVNHALSSQLINQMSREDFDFEQTERYSFVFAAGFAVGLINLGKGKIIARSELPVSLNRLSLAERLVKLMNGGERQLCFVDYDRVKLHECCVNGHNGGYAGSRFSNEMLRAKGPNDPNILRSREPHSSHVRQLSNVNVHLTSPAACMALALMYLKTGDEWITQMLSIPETLYDIEKIRPDVLMLRVMAKCLVNFQSIDVSMRYVDEQVPQIALKYVRRFMHSSPATDTKKSKTVWWKSFVDISTVAQKYFYDCVEMDGAVELGNSTLFARLRKAAGRNCIYACINVCAISAALIMAGSGHLDTLRMLRKIRNLQRPADGVDETVTPLSGAPPKEVPGLHGIHVSANMALGLLFIGHGRLSLATSNVALASLLISVFPIFPQSITDNRVYFQPLRFLWTLAVETRFLSAVDSATVDSATVDSATVDSATLDPNTFIQNLDSLLART